MSDDPLELLLAKRLAAVPREDRDDSPNSLCGRYVSLARENHELRKLWQEFLDEDHFLPTVGWSFRIKAAAEGKELAP